MAVAMLPLTSGYIYRRFLGFEPGQRYEPGVPSAVLDSRVPEKSHQFQMEKVPDIMTNSIFTNATFKYTLYH